ncbi:hypothetical protein [Demequina maris]|uniref:hypothetical protein n=1 Tax=Demequina maris TaxID=1638982 RepID=UPI0012E01AFF|nr:hypothetical protein [Demequina maris]
MPHFPRGNRAEDHGTGHSDLNALYSASLEFGANWRRPLDELAAEHLPHRSDPELAELVVLIAECRRAIEDHVLSAYLSNQRKWHRPQAAAAEQWIRTTYPWMNRRNRKRAINQGVYYAYHDHG